MTLTPTKSGWIEVICGPMFSGKTEELIRRLVRAQFAKQRVSIFKPGTDNRYSEDYIVSHNQRKIKSVIVNSSKKILDFMAQPFGHMPELLVDAEYITKVNAICMICGDPANFSQRISNEINQVVVGETDKYEARCRKCFSPIAKEIE